MYVPSEGLECHSVRLHRTLVCMMLFHWTFINYFDLINYMNCRLEFVWIYLEEEMWHWHWSDYTTCDPWNINSSFTTHNYFLCIILITAFSSKYSEKWYLHKFVSLPNCMICNETKIIMWNLPDREAMQFVSEIAYQKVRGRQGKTCHKPENFENRHEKTICVQVLQADRRPRTKQKVYRHMDSLYPRKIMIHYFAHALGLIDLSPKFGNDYGPFPSINVQVK